MQARKSLSAYFKALAAFRKSIEEDDCEYGETFAVLARSLARTSDRAPFFDRLKGMLKLQPTLLKDAVDDLAAAERALAFCSTLMVRFLGKLAARTPDSRTAAEAISDREAK